MDFRWNDWNLWHVCKHGVNPSEAEAMVWNAVRPFPLYRGDGKWLVWGRGSGGRWLQLIFLIDVDDSIFIIHARPLTEREKKRLRRRLK